MSPTHHQVGWLRPPRQFYIHRHNRTPYEVREKSYFAPIVRVTRPLKQINYMCSLIDKKLKIQRRLMLIEKRTVNYMNHWLRREITARESCFIKQKVKV